MATDPELEIHRHWLGLLQPVGLVVSPPALVKGQAIPERNPVALQHQFASLCDEQPIPPDGDPELCLPDFPAFASGFLGWAPEDLAGAPGGPDLPEGLEVALPEYGDTLRPDFVAVDSMGEGKPLALVRVVEPGTKFDDLPVGAEVGWHASPQARLERLLREREIPTGLLLNGTHLRLVYAPRGESSGHLTFPVAAMLEVAGRPILAAFHMLLAEHRMFSAPKGRRLLDLMVDSRRYQSEVSTELAGQVLGALWDLLRGFQAADEAAGGRLLGDADTDLQQVYGGMLTTLLRLVFLLYAEDKDLMPSDPVYVNNYSVGGLYHRLREDHGLHPDTMDQRYGAWAWLLALFRLVYDGGGHAGLRLPARHGQLFDPDEHPFLEGRTGAGEGSVEVPRVSDGCLYRVLDALLVLKGERLSYRTLDVEQIGSVYEAMMGFSVERAQGLSLGVKGDTQKKGAVPADPVIDVEALLAQKPADRAKWLQDKAGVTAPAKGLKEAITPDDVVAAFGKKVSRYTPNLIARRAQYLQPGEERRRSGSHYTPRELTEPIVRTTLRPVLEALGERPTPEQILNLAVCDPAMGSGAFLVETCRQLAEKLVQAWEAHGRLPEIPSDEEPLQHALRLVAQRCLYGVDKNPFAVNLAKLSLWLVTLARDHAFTFVDHSLKHGDSLVGLTREQIAAFHWKEPKKGPEPLFEGLEDLVDSARDHRSRILEMGDTGEDDKRNFLREAEHDLEDLRLLGDLAISAFFSSTHDRDRENRRLVLRSWVDEWKRGARGRADLEAVARELRTGDRPVPAFHWEIEFPEVFGRENPGFDAVVGNPPFLGGRRISTVYGLPYFDYLKNAFPGAGNLCDLVAYFFRRSFLAIRQLGAFGLLSTNTISEGDTREGGLAWIRRAGGSIFSAKRRTPWPGQAAVIVSQVHCFRGQYFGVSSLDGKRSQDITSYLFDGGGDSAPVRLQALSSLFSDGSKIYGQGFLFDDDDPKSNPISEMNRLLASHPEVSNRIFPYIGGWELNHSPQHLHSRYAIYLSDIKDEADLGHWEPLVEIVREKVMPYRLGLSSNPVNDSLKRRWWAYQAHRPRFYESIRQLRQVLALSQVSSYHALAFLPIGMIYSHNLILFSLDTYASFAWMQCQVHEVWARFFSSSLGDALRYSASDCFETFPFAPGWTNVVTVESAGKAYYDHRASLMIANNEGLTATYNRFHDPAEQDPGILKLRELHKAMDRAVLDAYGWQDIPTHCEFFLDYEIDEEEWGNKKKPWRYRWPDDVHDEVLARLLDLNQKRAEEERLQGLEESGRVKKGAPRKSRKAKAGPKNELGLFGPDE